MWIADMWIRIGLPTVLSLIVYVLTVKLLDNLILTRSFFDIIGYTKLI